MPTSISLPCRPVSLGALLILAGAATGMGQEPAAGPADDWDASASRGQVVIAEIMWMGSAGSSAGRRATSRRTTSILSIG